MLRTHFGWILLATAGMLAWRPASMLAEEFSTVREAVESVTMPELRKHVETLANDTFEGRESGSRGGQAAGVYLAQFYRQLGLAGGGTTGYFQAFNGQARNILGVLEGSDPVLKDQVIVISAHYDHVGYGTATNSYGPIGLIHNGADDNASGDAGLLELAEAFSKLKQRPKRTIVFAFWDAEEKGLLGSKHWLANPTIPLQRVVFNFNVDMIGRLHKNQIELIGSRTSRGLRRLFADHNEATDLGIDFTWEMKKNSDHYSFFERSIPCVMIHTGLHGDYHRPSDDVEKIDFAGLERVTRLIFGAVHEMANLPGSIQFRPASRSETPFARTQLEQPLAPLPSRLGISWDAAASKPGLRVTVVDRGSPAEIAGLRAGDRIVSIDGHELKPGDDPREQILASSGSAKLKVERPDVKDPLELPVQLQGSRVRVGLAWREDEAEPGSVLLLRVVPGSPADKAGLAVLDRIYQLNGERFANGDEFLERLTKATDKIEVRMERQGRPRTLTLQLTPVVEKTAAR